MSIERTLSTQPVATTGSVQTTMNDAKGVREASTPRTGGQVKSGTQVTISDASRQMAGSSDIDMARVTQIKDAIARGELHLDAGKIADALLADNAFFE
ncbi:flagellar biosynthesis anti-sigma factor FlgM [Enterobacteriaceae bacterium YMB-R22]|jgi:negative regulator of flagellin synthesis FlgM|uniref:flagellar biosynthesis anti-sigma factor FlgM n=1 Tax=Tenebrionicola larvae TaxID=2815733 RepID=UPI002013714A|nr:flagellar biosynthesis anti-sigma factor FlgM [Tenebrionicola larvae]MBV4413987.1 flagellar biosynthesis anti-sigma factor FlgM [Tenebrionicola larvae]